LPPGTSLPNPREAPLWNPEVRRACRDGISLAARAKLRKARLP
jgi:hypothetical protein